MVLTNDSADFKELVEYAYFQASILAAEFIAVRHARAYYIVPKRYSII